MVGSHHLSFRHVWRNIVLQYLILTCFCWPRLYDGFDGAPRRPQPTRSRDRGSAEAPALIGTYTVTAFASHVHSTRALNLLDPSLSICSCTMFSILDNLFDVFNGCSSLKRCQRAGLATEPTWRAHCWCVVMEVDSTAFSSFSFL